MASLKIFIAAALTFYVSNQQHQKAERKIAYN